MINKTKHNHVLEHFIEVFDVIVADYQNKQESAKNVLNTLNQTLTTLKNSLKKTLLTMLNSIKGVNYAYSA